jgi:hypothetical protein
MIEIRCDMRLLTLASVLTACSPIPEVPQRPLVTDTHQRLSKIIQHPSSQWLSDAEKRVDLLGLAMQTVQLGAPPHFSPAPIEETPWYVQEYFSQVSAIDLSRHLEAIWQDANLEEHFQAQQSLWEEAEADLASVFAGIEVDGFQEQFFGSFPYHLVAVPLANMAIEGWRAVGVANLREAYAVLISNKSYQSHGIEIVGLAQHEASHPVLADIQRLYPDVPTQCAFVEQAYAPTNRFAREYSDPGYRWIEMVIRTSTYFYLQSLGLSEEAERYLRWEIEGGVTAIEVFVKALGPWWHERQRGKAAGLDKILDELPSWLQRAVSELGT